MPTFNTNTFYISPRNARVIVQNDTGIGLPTTHDSYYVYNVGSTNIKVSVKSGNSIMWTRTLKTVSLEPGEGALLDMSRYKCYISGVEVKNSDDKNGFIHCCQVSGYPLYDSADAVIPMDIQSVSEMVVTFGASVIPKSGDDLSKTLRIYWPKTEESAWDKITSIVLPLVDDIARVMVKDTVAEINAIGERIEEVAGELSEHVHKPESLEKYMKIAEDLINFEQKFVLKDTKTKHNIKHNFVFLAFYSSVVSLKLKYYQYGRVSQQKIRLDDAAADRLKDYSEMVLQDAIAHVNQVRQNQLDLEYETVYSELLYDGLVTVRAYSSLNGLEYFALWQSIVEDPKSTDDPNNNVITFSNYVGRPTPMLHRQMVMNDHLPPFQPILVDDKINKLKSITIYTLSDSTLNEPKIAGLSVTYENGDKADTGKVTEEFKTINLDGAHVIKLNVWGYGQVDGLEFHLCDKSSVKIGTTEGDQSTFQLMNHHIVGFFMGNDFKQLEGQAANLCVAFQIGDRV